MPSELESQDFCTTAMSMSKACRRDASWSDLDLMPSTFHCRMRRNERVTDFMSLVSSAICSSKSACWTTSGRAEVQFYALCFSSYRFMPQHLWQNLPHFAQRRRDWPAVGFEIAQGARQCTFAVADGALGAAVLLMVGSPL